jgi:uncharacterized RmlC-like cupin family protein
MAKTKYGDYIKSLTFQDYGPGSYRQGTIITPEFLGLDVHIEFGTFWVGGKMGKEPYESEVHDFNEVMLWMGADTGDLSELGAEVELCLGEEKEKHMITSSQAVFVPGGFPHLPANAVRMNQRFLFLSISMTPEWKAKQIRSEREPSGIAGWQSKYRSRVSHLTFTRKSAWHYGPENPDDAGGSITDITAREFDFNMSYESIRKAPYRFGPRPDKPHSHTFDEFALFLGADTGDLSVLGAEVETGMGKEIERHVITTPSVIKLPKQFPHGPLAVNRLDKPFIFAIIRPFGVGKDAHSSFSP